MNRRRRERERAAEEEGRQDGKNIRQGRREDKQGKIDGGGGGEEH